MQIGHRNNYLCECGGLMNAETAFAYNHSHINTCVCILLCECTLRQVRHPRPIQKKYTFIIPWHSFTQAAAETRIRGAFFFYALTHRVYLVLRENSCCFSKNCIRPRDAPKSVCTLQIAIYAYLTQFFSPLTLFSSDGVIAFYLIPVSLFIYTKAPTGL